MRKLFLSGIAFLLLFSNCKYPYWVNKKDASQIKFRIDKKEVSLFPHSGSDVGYTFVDSSKDVYGTFITTLNFKNDGTCNVVYYYVDSLGKSDNAYKGFGKYTLRGKNRLVAELYWRHKRYLEFKVWHFKIKNDGIKRYLIKSRGMYLFSFDNTFYKSVDRGE